MQVTLLWHGARSITVCLDDSTFMKGLEILESHEISENEIMLMIIVLNASDGY